MKYIFNKLSQILIYFFVLIINLYQLLISPLLGSNCRFTPTCSKFTIDAIKTNGLIRGLVLSIKRISSCHPYGRQGYDPVPNKKEKN